MSRAPALLCSADASYIFSIFTATSHPHQPTYTLSLNPLGCHFKVLLSSHQRMKSVHVIVAASLTCAPQAPLLHYEPIPQRLHVPMTVAYIRK